MTETETVQHGATEVAGTEGAHEAAEGAGNIGEHILHHVMDAHEWDFGFFSIPLPEINIGGYDFSITKHVIMMWITSAILLLAFTSAARRAKEPVPRGVRNMLEVFMLFLRDEVARKSIPHHADRYVGYLMTTFFFILVCNLLGLVPGMATATGNISVTAALALIAFVQIQWGGIREYGVWGHFKNLAPTGIPVVLVPLMVVMEFLGMLVKPFALCIRLFANMMAGHVVILAFVSLIFILKDFWFVVAPFSIGFALFINGLELMIALIQAYIFTILTATFIGMSVHPAH